MMAVYALPPSQSIATLCRARMPTLGCAAAEPASIVLLVAAKRPYSGWRRHAIPASLCRSDRSERSGVCSTPRDRKFTSLRRARQPVAARDLRSPQLATMLNSVALGLYFSRDYEAARRTIRSYPGYRLTHRWLAAALGQLGRTDEAKGSGRSAAGE